MSNILLLSSLILSSAFAQAVVSSDTNAYIAALTQLLEQKTIGDTELVNMLEAAEDGRVVNPISPIRAETSVEHFVANIALEELLQGKIDASRVVAWTEENIKAQDRVRKKRKQTQEETKQLWKDDYYAGLSAGEFGSCAITIDGTVRCWGKNKNDALWGAFKSVSVGSAHSCGLRLDGAVECWGRNDEGQSNAPSGVFKSVSAAMYHTCGVMLDGTLKCWGAASVIPRDTSGVFQSVSAAMYHTCGLKVDGTVKCWGSNQYGESTAPSGLFRSVTVGRVHTCGVKTDGSIKCWGENSDGQANAPSGLFRSLSAGARYNCGMRADGTIKCWGNNNHGQCSATPSGIFRVVSAGQSHACGLRVDGRVECWGSSWHEESSPPENLIIPTGQIYEVHNHYYYDIVYFIQRIRSWSNLS